MLAGVLLAAVSLLVVLLERRFSVLLLLVCEALLALPSEVSLEGTAVAPTGMEFSYSRLTFSIAERILLLIVISSVSARV